MRPTTDVTFTTLFHARISTDGTFRWADAGHGLSLVLRSDGTVDRLRSSDLPLGMGLRDAWATTEGFLDTGDLGESQAIPVAAPAVTFADLNGDGPVKLSAYAPSTPDLVL